MNSVQDLIDYGNQYLDELLYTLSETYNDEYALLMYIKNEIANKKYFLTNKFIKILYIKNKNKLYIEKDPSLIIANKIDIDEFYNYIHFSIIDINFKIKNKTFKNNEYNRKKHEKRYIKSIISDIERIHKYDIKLRK